MKEKSKNIDILEHIVKYCLEIDDAKHQFDNSFEAFEKNSIFRNAVSMCFLQIGELVKHLTPEFKQYNDTIEWHKIQGMRNIFAHDYGNIDISIVWRTMETEIPRLEDFCIKTIKYFQVINQESESLDEDEFDLWEPEQ